MNDDRIPGEHVSQVTCSEILISTGIQLIHFAHDIAFTDAAFGETWSVEAANRMASLSEILNLLYRRLPKRTLGIVVDLPEGMIGIRTINPNYDPGAAKPGSENTGDADKEGGVDTIIDDLPF